MTGGSSRPQSVKLPRYTLDALDAPTLYFFHIPKTAGSSLELALTSHFLPEQMGILHLWNRLLKIPPEQLAGFRLISGHFYNHVYPLLPRAPITLTLLRDPVERSLSHYRHIWRQPEHYLYAKAHQLGDLMSLLQDAEGRAFFSNFQTRMLALTLDAPALTAQTVDWEQPFAIEKILELATIPGISDAELLKRAQTRLDSFEFVGLTERIQAFIWLLDYQFGWWPAPEAPRENVTPDAQVYGAISPDAIALLREMTALDAELYRNADLRFSADSAQMNIELLQEHAFAANPSFSQQVIEVTFDYDLPGTGWYAPERSADGHFYRWLGPASTATVFLSVPKDRAVTLTGYIFAGMSEDILNSLTLTVEDTPVPLTITLASQYSYQFSGIIPAGAASTSGLTRLSFQVSRTISPYDLDPQSPDTRSLSLALRWLRLSYAAR